MFKSVLLVSFLVLVAGHSYLFAQKDKGFNFPPDIGKTETIILLTPYSNDDKVTESIMEAFEKEYKGKYEVTGDKYAKAKKYQDAKYQYMVVVMENHKPAEWRNRERIAASTDYKFGLMDIKTGKTYYTEFWSGVHKKGARYYVKHLEEFRKQNATTE